MQCIEISEPGAPAVLKAAQREAPVARAGELLISVFAAGVNRPDVMQRLGLYPAPPGASDLPGLEVAGEVAAVGAGVTGWQVGDRVCALTNGGGYAEQAVAPAGQCLPVPAGMDFVAAAGLPETFFTVWTNVFMRGRAPAGARWQFGYRHQRHSDGACDGGDGVRHGRQRREMRCLRRTRS